MPGSPSETSSSPTEKATTLCTRTLDAVSGWQREPWQQCITWLIPTAVSLREDRTPSHYTAKNGEAMLLSTPTRANPFPHGIRGDRSTPIRQCIQLLPGVVATWRCGRLIYCIALPLRSWCSAFLLGINLLDCTSCLARSCMEARMMYKWARQGATLQLPIGLINLRLTSSILIKVKSSKSCQRSILKLKLPTAPAHAPKLPPHLQLATAATTCERRRRRRRVARRLCTPTSSQPIYRGPPPPPPPPASGAAIAAASPAACASERSSRAAAAVWRTRSSSGCSCLLTARSSWPSFTRSEVEAFRGGVVKMGGRERMRGREVEFWRGRGVQE